MSDAQQNSIALIAQAESILNRTLAYQAAIAVHEIKERLDLDVEELRLVVAPWRPDAPGTYHVICTIAALAIPDSIVVEIVVQPDKALAPATRAAE